MMPLVEWKGKLWKTIFVTHTTAEGSYSEHIFKCLKIIKKMIDILIEKIGKILDWHLTKEEIKIADKHMKSCLIS